MRFGNGFKLNKKDSKMNKLVTIENAKSIEEFANMINDRVQSSNKSWYEIAELLSEARDIYGGESTQFQQLLTLTKFSKSTGHKLAAIASSVRLAKHKKDLMGVHSWSTLYTIHSLSDEIFEKLKIKFGFGKKQVQPAFITISDINKIKKENDENGYKVGYTTLATIKISNDVFKNHKMDINNLQQIIAEINSLASVFDELIIQQEKSAERYQSSWNKQFENELYKINKELVDRLVDGLCKRNQYKKKDKNFYSKIFGVRSKSELYEFAMGDMDGFIDGYGSYYDVHSVNDKAYHATMSYFEERAQKSKTKTTKRSRTKRSNLVAFMQ
jgi:hypothetical protein